jgi:hypothetical protein
MKYHKPYTTSIQTKETCAYGCGNTAQYRFRSGVLCCSKHYNSCPEKRKNFSENVDHLSAGRKSLATRVASGMTKIQAKKATATRIKQGHYKKLAKTMRRHWAKNPWDNHGKWRTYEDTGILLQSNYEYNFLQELAEEHGIQYVKDNVKRGPCFYYKDPTTKKERLYISDFKIDNTIFEVKGNYTWNNHGKDKKLEKLNKAKLDSVKENNYNVILVLEGKRIKI